MVHPRVRQANSYYQADAPPSVLNHEDHKTHAVPSTPRGKEVRAGAPQCTPEAAAAKQSSTQSLLRKGIAAHESFALDGAATLQDSLRVSRTRRLLTLSCLFFRPPLLLCASVRRSTQCLLPTYPPELFTLPHIANSTIANPTHFP